MVRREPEPGCLATIEAVAAALRVLEPALALSTTPPAAAGGGRAAAGGDVVVAADVLVRVFQRMIELQTVSVLCVVG